MNRVGEELVTIALGKANADEIDLFGRSAINRFYYACFLDARKALLCIHPSLAIKHKELPTNIKKTIAEIVRREISRLERQTVISTNEAITYRATLNNIVSNLAEILENAYKLRVIADYEPDKKAVKVGWNVVIDGKSSAMARDWHRRTEQSVARMMRLWRDLGHETTSKI